jgi:hypothetical protein
MTLFLVENTIEVSGLFQEKDHWILLLPFLSFLGTFTYSKLHTLLTYLCCLLYTTVRTYFIWTDYKSYIQFNLYLWIAFLIAFICQRRLHQTERDHFLLAQDHKLVIALLQEMLDAQPETCMLMVQEESETKPMVDRIVYYNQRAMEMFGVQKQLVGNQGVGQEERVLEKR